MFMIVAPNKVGDRFGPFGDYNNALGYARSRCQDHEFYITGSELEGWFTLGIPNEL